MLATSDLVVASTLALVSHVLVMVMHENAMLLTDHARTVSTTLLVMTVNSVHLVTMATQHVEHHRTASHVHAR
jgi:hypothetical protein